MKILQCKYKGGTTDNMVVLFFFYQNPQIYKVRFKADFQKKFFSIKTPVPQKREHCANIFISDRPLWSVESVEGKVI